MSISHSASFICHYRAVILKLLNGLYYLHLKNRYMIVHSVAIRELTSIPHSKTYLLSSIFHNYE